MAVPYLLIATALEFEAKPIARALGLRWTTRTTAVSERGDVRLQIVGPRATRLPESTDHCTGVILAGLAGGLDPALRRGEVVVDERGEAIDASIRRGRIATVATLASTTEAKATLRHEAGALVVDMENAIVRDWSRARGLPFVGLRAVSDTADESLDPATLRIVDAAGFLSARRLAIELLRRPTVAASLWQMRTTRAVVDALAECVSEVVERLGRKTPS